ncbi:WAS/WASL-interacting protein family member 1-like isoform X2 [Gadus macrocephalus]|uniref:WAS/WASL-interacting protein family member 1-like isoform X2 n=1 Tax=Gadus macrocephalus TaxID=80720 RepID=UPI0028CB479D|nr:WAS/WASL-interacting protein family member 1-like isoform X2 [Gadus macrocephalus]
MLIPQTLRRLLLPLLLVVVVVVVVAAGACVCVDGGPVRLPRRDTPDPVPLVTSSGGSGALVHVTDTPEGDGSAAGGGDGGGGGGGGVSGGPGVRQAAPGEARGARNGGVFGAGRSGPGMNGGREEVLRRERREVWAEGEAPGSLSEAGEDQSRPTPYTARPPDSEGTTPGSSATEFNSTASIPRGATSTSPDDGEAPAEVVNTPGSTPSGPPALDPALASPTGAPSSKEPPGASAGDQGPQIPGPTPSVAPSLGAPPLPPLADWGPDDATAPIVPDLLLAEVGPDVMPKPEGPESLWSEAASDSEADTEVPLTQDQSTEGTMSSEDLPLIFDPFDDVTPQGASTAGGPAAPGGPQPPASATATGGTLLSEAAFDRSVTVETDGDGPSHPPPMLPREWMSPWQTPGTELLGPSASPVGPLDHHAVKDSDNAEGLEEPSSISGLAASSLLSSGTPVTKATHHHVSKSTSGLEEMESEEESDEDDSEEEQTNTPASNRPPYSLIPPPPVWVQRNQGLMRSWMELIREKAGYVSGMLVPVGIGIAGAILIVGALNSIRMIHRRRRNSFKYQRRKVRQQEQPRETGPGRPDQAMLLADSSEDEF